MLTASSGVSTIGPAPVLFNTQLATIVAPSVILYADASRCQPAVGQLQRGERVVVIFVQGDWYKIRHADSREGWLERAATSTCFEDLEVAQIRTGSLASLTR